MQQEISHGDTEEQRKILIYIMLFMAFMVNGNNFAPLHLSVFLSRRSFTKAEALKICIFNSRGISSARY